MTSAGLTRWWRPDWPCPLDQIWSHWRRGAGDPSYRILGTTHWRGFTSPDGPVTLRATPDPAAGTIEATAWGPGADWALEHVPALLGADDDPASFQPRHPALADAQLARPHWRVGRGPTVMSALLPAVLEQKVTGQEAFASYRRLVVRFGSPAPGAGATVDLWVPPSAQDLRRIPSWSWLQLMVDHARSSTVVRAAAVAPALERTLDLDRAAADRRLRAVPGIGVWTSAEVRSRAHGDPDAVSFGDVHVARNIGWALTGSEIDDDGLLALLEPYRGHRFRVQRLLELAGIGHPRRGARMAPRTHLPGGSPRRGGGLRAP
ncbi:MAG: DNA-3-methyladenine glycosylase family protein [Propioniciclava sp.]